MMLHYCNSSQLHYYFCPFFSAEPATSQRKNEMKVVFYRKLIYPFIIGFPINIQGRVYMTKRSITTDLQYLLPK